MPMNLLVEARMSKIVCSKKCGEYLYHACNRKCGPVDLWVVGCGQNMYTKYVTGSVHLCGPVDLWTCGPVDLWTCGLWTE